jgi:hypothetical protein
MPVVRRCRTLCPGCGDEGVRICLRRVEVFVSPQEATIIRVVNPWQSRQCEVCGSSGWLDGVVPPT